MGSPFISQDEASTRIERLQREVVLSEAVLAIARALHPFPRDERAVIVRRVKEALGCDLIEGPLPRSTGPGC